MLLDMILHTERFHYNVVDIASDLSGMRDPLSCGYIFCDCYGSVNKKADIPHEEYEPAERVSDIHSGCSF